jgi:hypothetical protein
MWRAETTSTTRPSRSPAGLGYCTLELLVTFVILVVASAWCAT